MARIVLAGDDDVIVKLLGSGMQSGHVNCLVGSGCSFPAIPIAGTIESKISALFSEDKEDEAASLLYDFLSSVFKTTNSIIDKLSVPQIDEAIANYTDLLRILERTLVRRNSTVLNRQASLFTTNYDLLLELASKNLEVMRLQDGFERTPAVNERPKYSSRQFFTTQYNNGNVYNYEVEIPVINLVKLHGSVGWVRGVEVVEYEVLKHEFLDLKDLVSIKKFIQQLALVLPRPAKFSETTLDRVYYDLLRLYANQLDRENSLLLVFGFSFFDEHIADITTRALRNPTLLIVIFSHDADSTKRYCDIFSGSDNVVVVAPEDDDTLPFSSSLELLTRSVPSL